MMLIPIYFQVSAHTSVTTAGAHLMPAVIGNALGGILSGIVIKRLDLSPIQYPAQLARSSKYELTYESGPVIIN
jgi:hypothetical protein